MPDANSSSSIISDPLRSRPALLLFAGWWVLLGVLFSLQIQMSYGFRGLDKPWEQALIAGFLDSLSWAAVAVAALWLSGRLEAEKWGWLRLIGIHALAAIIIVPARLWVFGAIADYLLNPGPSTMTVAQRIGIAFPTNLLAYVMLVAVGYAVHFVRRHGESELIAARLESRLASAELEVMKMQLQPPFLSRALRSISGMMHRDVAAADRGLALLGDMLRLMLQRIQRQMVSLREELELLELYVSFRQEEIGGRLQLTWECEPAAMDAEVPSLLLQPTIEQVIRWSDAADGEPLRLSVIARRRGEMLELEAVGDGLSRAARARERESSAMTTIRARLRHLYGPGHHLCFSEQNDSVARVLFRLPYREARGIGTETLVTSAPHTGAAAVAG